MRANLHDLNADDAPLVEHEALAHDGVLARVAPVARGRLGVPVVDPEYARPLRPGVALRAPGWRLVHQLQVDDLAQGQGAAASIILAE